MEESINPSPVPSNCTSPVCSDPAHDDLALNAEWSDETSDCDGDGPHRDAEDHDVQDDQDDLDGQEDEEESQGVQQDLFSLSGATAPEILTGVEPRAPSASKLLSDAAMAQAAVQVDDVPDPSASMISAAALDAAL